MINRIENTPQPSLTLKPLTKAIKTCLKNAMPATGLALLITGSGFVNAATFHVANTQDSGPGSLRQAVLDANASAGADEIVFSTSATGTVNLTSGHLEIFESVTVTGPGPDVLSIDAGKASEIFVVSEPSSASAIEFTLSGLTLSNSTAAISAGVGFIDIDVTVSDCTITGSTGPAISVFSYFSEGRLEISDSTISHNEGVAINPEGSPYSSNRAYLSHLNITDNGGAGVDSSGAAVTIDSSEVRGNAVGLLGNTNFNYLGTYFSVADTVIADNKDSGVSLGHSDTFVMQNTALQNNVGAGIHAYNLYVDATIRSSTISGNGKGGIDFGVRYSNLSVINSTITGNRNGKGIDFNSYQGKGLIQNSTIADNDSGGVTAASEFLSEFVIRNSIIAENGSGNGADLSGVGAFTIHHSLVQNPGNSDITESTPDSNLFGQSPLLGSLQNHGGFTETQALQKDSPAIDTGDSATCEAVDQRNVSRLTHGICDMGAYEYESEMPASGNGKIGDLVWRDINGNGAHDIGEPGLGGVVVNLRVNCDPTTIMTAVTDSKGAYLFDELPAGDYQLEFVAPDGYQFSPQMAAGNYRIDSNADPSTGLDQCRPLSNWQSRRALDAGLVPLTVGEGNGTMGNLVWRDDNKDGVQDAGEPGLPGVTVNLRVDCDPHTVMSTTTNRDGTYRFDRLPDGHYQLEFVKPSRYSFSPLIAAGDYTKDSNADPQTGLDQCRWLHNGQHRLALDAGLFPQSQ